MFALQQRFNHLPILPILDVLIKQYRLFDLGFRISIPSSLDTQAREVQMVAILVIKTHLILYQPRRAAHKIRLEMICSLLTRLPDYLRWDLTQIRDLIMHSPWSAYLPILPLNMNPPQFNSSLWNKYPDKFTTIPVDYAEWHKEMGLQCIWIFSGMSSQHMVLYAQDHWINHILSALPSDKMLQALLDNAALLNKEDARKVLEWAEGADESQDQLAQQLIMRIWRYLEPRPVKFRQQSCLLAGSKSSLASDGSHWQCGRDVGSESDRHKAKPSLIVEKPTKSINIDQSSENKAKHRWMEKLCCF
ncbi:hypothetical protein BT96DRAFT_307157 [Gymnopus androsaceus JB14]|uniref:Uncharacterized protein n=1 Tax=Gymnopus androsaceus JB14 TaxID=1447944 RepID=A0A6A4I5S0_9AGAR|nr:hypothetical protein BT96DRAFT_307157 [Gymnopus androsaceus JB14]